MTAFTGAAAQLQNGALLVNPHDVEGVADAIHRAFRMDLDERRERMRRMRNSVRNYDIYWWLNAFLESAFSKGLADFPSIEMDFHSER